MKRFFVCTGRGKKYAKLALHKPLNKGEGKHCARELMRIAKERRLKCFLLDSRNVKCLSTATEKFVFAHTDLDVIKFDRQLKVAILASKDDHTHDHLEAICYMAGYRIKVFRNLDMAITWLEN